MARLLYLQKSTDSINPQGPVHVMHLLDSHEDKDDLWLVLEYFNCTLDAVDHLEMTQLALMSISADTAKGLREMQCAVVVDDDVKPANMAFKARSGRVAHLDLGCARLAGEPPLGSTAGYSAPEIAMGIASDTSPCYGWARTMEYLAFGKIGLGPDDLLCDYVPWVGRAFANLVGQCCHDDPDRRPVVEDLDRNLKKIMGARVRCPRCNAVKFPDGQCPCC